MRALVVMLGCLVLSACADDKPPTHTRSGEELYNFYCAPCHKGSGDGVFLKGVPPVRHTELSYRQMVDRIKGYNKRKDSRMPAFDLTTKQAESIALYVRRRLKGE